MAVLPELHLEKVRDDLAASGAAGGSAVEVSPVAADRRKQF
jgi:hypothetical protein